MLAFNGRLPVAHRSLEATSSQRPPAWQREGDALAVGHSVPSSAASYRAFKAGCCSCIVWAACRKQRARKIATDLLRPVVQATPQLARSGLTRMHAHGRSGGPIVDAASSSSVSVKERYLEADSPIVEVAATAHAAAARKREHAAGPIENVATTHVSVIDKERGDAEAPHTLRLGEDVPGNAWSLGVRTFKCELGQLIQAMENIPLLQPLADLLGEQAPDVDRSLPPRPPPFVQKLSLDIDAIHRREAARGIPETTPAVEAIFFLLSWSLDRIYEKRPIQRFWVLETVARLPYFSYITVLHLYESLGWWRTPQLRAIHNAEEDNELHHLLIMESLGGGSEWFDRFAAQHAALAYYWLIVVLFVANPALAYNFSLLVEEHAFVTYSQFVEENKEVLRDVPPPPIAVEYYKDGDLYLFDKFHTGGKSDENATGRRPPCENLLDVFKNIRDDEFEHIRTMEASQRWWEGNGPPVVEESHGTAAAKREAWLRWSAAVNTANSERT